MSLPIQKLRTFWAHRQGLLEDTTQASEVLERAGWARSVGGSNPYLTLFSRGGIDRFQGEAAAKALEIHELPSARGCTYVVPARHFGLSLKCAEGFADAASMRTATKFLGVTEDEIARLQEAIVLALQEGPLDPRALKVAVGDAVRNLGEIGKKRGQTTTLSLALGFLQTSGRIRRVPMDGRLDQERYAYTLWPNAPLFQGTKDEAYTELARLYWGWIGVASVANFQWFSGLGVKAAKEAVATLELQPLQADSDLLISPDSVTDWNHFEPPTQPDVRLVSSLDSLVLLRRNHQDLIEPVDFERSVLSNKQLVGIGGVADLPNNAIVDRGRIIGLWEYEFAEQKIVSALFVPRTEAIDAAITKTEKFVASQLGDCRSSSLDSPKSREPYTAALRQMMTT